MFTLCLDRYAVSARTRARAALLLDSLRLHLARAAHRVGPERLIDALRARSRRIAQGARALDGQLRESELGALAFFLALILTTFLV